MSDSNHTVNSSPSDPRESQRDIAGMPVLTGRLDPDGGIELKEAARAAGWKPGQILRVEVSSRGVVLLRPWKGRGDERGRPRYINGKVPIDEDTREWAALSTGSPVLVLVDKAKSRVYLAGAVTAIGPDVE